MSLPVGSSGFWCVRCGLPYEPASGLVPSRHPVHPEDHGNTPILARLADLPRRQALLRGEYDLLCPACPAGPGEWCTESGDSLPGMHPERRV